MENPIILHNDHILDTTAKTIVHASNIFHDHATTQNSNLFRNSSSYFLLPSTLKIRSITVENPIYNTSSKSNNTVQEATDDPT